MLSFRRRATITVITGFLISASVEMGRAMEGDFECNGECEFEAGCPSLLRYIPTGVIWAYDEGSGGHTSGQIWGCYASSGSEVYKYHIRCDNGSGGYYFDYHQYASCDHIS